MYVTGHNINLVHFIRFQRFFISTVICLSQVILLSVCVCGNMFFICFNHLCHIQICVQVNIVCVYTHVSHSFGDESQLGGLVD